MKKEKVLLGPLPQIYSWIFQMLFNLCFSREGSWKQICYWIKTFILVTFQYFYPPEESSSTL